MRISIFMHTWTVVLHILRRIVAESLRAIGAVALQLYVIKVSKQFAGRKQ